MSHYEAANKALSVFRIGPKTDLTRPKERAETRHEGYFSPDELGLHGFLIGFSCVRRMGPDSVLTIWKAKYG